MLLKSFQLLYTLLQNLIVLNMLHNPISGEPEDGSENIDRKQKK
jgi:hypothetical protein